MPKIFSVYSKGAMKASSTNRRGHHLIFKSVGFKPGPYLNELEKNEFGLEAGFSKNLGSVTHVVVVLRKKPLFADEAAVCEYFKTWKQSPVSVSKISSPKLNFHAMLPDVCQRLGGLPEHTVNFSETIRKPRLFVMRKIRLGLTLNGLRDMLFGDIPIELFDELRKNYEDYRDLIVRFDIIKKIQG